MAQQVINFGSAPDGAGGDNRRAALEKLQANDTELYGLVAAVVPYGGLRNLLINGDGRVNLRGFAGGAIAANKYGYDRWRALGSGSSLTIGAATISMQGTNCQVIESPDLAAATVTVSVSNPSGPIQVALQPDGTTASVSGTIPAGAGIQKVTLAVPSTLTGNVFLLLTVPGTVTIDGPAKRCGIQLECGSIASPFERRLIAVETMLCQRYFEARGYFVSAYNLAGTTIDVDVPFTVRKRATPTITWVSTSYANCSGITSVSTDSARFIPRATITSTGSATFNGQWAADAEL
jgi:hypothetical protein